MTELEIKKLKAKEKRYKVYLSDNIYLEVMPSGSKVYRYKKGNFTRTIGDSRVTTLKEAKSKAKSIAEQVQEEIDNPKIIEKTFKTLFYEWQSYNNWGTSTFLKRKSIIDIHISKLFKSKIKDITRNEILSTIRKIENAGKLETASRALRILKQVFDYALVCGDVENNPAAGLNIVLKKATVTPRAAITDEKNVRKLVSQIYRIDNDIIQGLFLFTMFTLCRPYESRLATWDEIHDNLWIIPAERMKMRKSHTVPLPSQCLTVLKTMQNYKQGKYIFPSIAKLNRPTSENTLLINLRRMGFAKGEMTIHGFRSMGSTILNEKGYRPDVIEKALAHAGEDKIRAIYNRAEYMEERRQMLQDYADYLEGLKLNSFDSRKI